jgi:hypothetical protein
MDTSAQTNKSFPMGLLAVAVIVLIGLGVVGFLATNKQQNTQTNTTASISPQITKTIMQKSTYKDGTYTVEGDYNSPGGAEQLGVTITLKNGVIADSTVESKAQRPMSVHFQGIFVANYKPLVVGKNIDEVKLDKVSGSSLSPKGFNDAIEKIKAEAKA